MVIYCVTTHPKSIIPLGSIQPRCYPQCIPYHTLFSEMPRLPQTSATLNRQCASHLIPSLDYPSIRLRKLAYFRVFSRSLQRRNCWLRWICTHRSLRRGTSSTNLMPICLHLGLPLVLLWYQPKGGF